ncbi:hypothetical protein GCM10020331_010480 [Ectobacillus funiculus]
MNAIESLQQQHKFITERSEQTNKRESKRDEQLAQLIQEVKETRKQIAAAEEKEREILLGAAVRKVGNPLKSIRGFFAIT